MDHPTFVSGRTTGLDVEAVLYSAVSRALSDTLKVRQVNVPADQKVSGAVSVYGIKDLREIMEKTLAHLQDEASDPRKVELTNQAEYPSEIAAVLKDLPAIERMLGDIERAVKDIHIPAPSVAIPSPNVHVEAPDLRPLLTGIGSLKAAIESIPVPEKTDFSAVSRDLKKVYDAIENLSFPANQRLATDKDGNVKVARMNALVPERYDSVIETEPDGATEVYTYKLAAATVATVTVSYFDSTKARFVSAVRT